MIDDVGLYCSIPLAEFGRQSGDYCRGKIDDKPHDEIDLTSSVLPTVTGDDEGHRSPPVGCCEIYSELIGASW